MLGMVRWAPQGTGKGGGVNLPWGFHTGRILHIWLEKMERGGYARSQTAKGVQDHTAEALGLHSLAACKGTFWGNSFHMGRLKRP